MATVATVVSPTSSEPTATAMPAPASVARAIATIAETTTTGVRGR